MTSPRRTVRATLRRLAPLALVSVALLATVGPAAAASDRGSRLVALDAGSGTLVPVEGRRGTFRLTLHDVRPTALWFDDRPGVRQGVMPVPALLRGLFAPGVTGPNAAISAIVADGDQELMGVKLERPSYDRKAATLRFRAVRLQQGGADEREDGRTDVVLPRSFGRTSLFIDDCCLRSTAATIFNTSVLPAEVIVNNGSPMEIGGAFAPLYVPQSAEVGFSPNAPAQGVLGPGANEIVLVPAGSIVPFTFVLEIPPTIQVTALQLYLAWSSSGAVQWLLLNDGRLVAGNASPLGRQLAGR